MESCHPEIPTKDEIVIRDIDYNNDFKDLRPMYVNAFEDQMQYVNISLATGEEHRLCLGVIFDIRLSLLRSLREHNIVMVAQQGGTVIGACGIQPNSCENTMFDNIWAGMPLLPFRFGYAGFMRAMKLGGSTTNTEIDPLGGKIVMTAVEPKFHGKGIGSLMLSTIIARWDSQPNRGNLVLLTQLESSVKFYQSFGFELTAEVKKDGYSNWSMIRRKPAPITSAQQ